MDSEASAHPELRKDQDAVATADPKGPGDLNSDSIYFPGVHEYHEVLGSGARYEENA